MDYGSKLPDSQGGLVPPGQVRNQPQSRPVVLDIDDRFLANYYKFRKRFFSLWGSRIDILDQNKVPQFHIYQKALRLREDIRIYGDPEHQEELLYIQARQIIDFSAAYDVRDMKTNNYIGTLRRKGWRSMARDSWEILDVNQFPIAKIQEDSLGMALLRRFLLGSLLPASFHFESKAGTHLATVKTHFNLFYTIMDLGIQRQAGARQIDPRLLIAGTALLVLLEGKQQSY